jgi:hypothetical protein
MLRWIVVVGYSSLAAACAGTEVAPTSVSDQATPSERHAIVLDRPQPKGSHARVRGQFEHYLNVKGKHMGWVVLNESDQFHVVYEADQTLLDVGLESRPESIRFDLRSLHVVTGSPAADFTLGRRRSRTLTGGLGTAGTVSAGQSFRLGFDGSKVTLVPISGVLSETERAVLVHPYGLSRELTKVPEVVLLFGTEKRQYVGARWKGDGRFARRAFTKMGLDFVPKNIQVEGTLEERMRVGPLDCLAISGTVHATGGRWLEASHGFETLSATVDLSYRGTFPANIELPPVDEATDLTIDTTIRRMEPTGPVDAVLRLEMHSRREVLSFS